MFDTVLIIICNIQITVHVNCKLSSSNCWN